MNIRDLTYVSALAKSGHFGRAALACNVSQPALSSQIKKLEAELGVILFERDTRSVRPTAAGLDLLPHIEEVLKRVETIRITANAFRDPLSGSFRLGFIPTIAPYLIPHFVRQSRDALPNLDLQLQEDITDRLNLALLNGDLDAAILATPPEDSQLEAITLYDEPFWVIFPTRHSLKMIATIRMQDIPVDELLLLSEGHCFRDQAMDVCQLDSSPQTRSIQATSLSTLVNMVASGQGITLIPAMALGAGWKGVSGIEMERLEDPAAYRRIYLTYRKRYPRQNLVAELGRLICNNLPETVRSLMN